MTVGGIFMDAGVKVTLAFLAGGALGAVGGYFIGRKIEEAESIKYGEELKEYYENLLEETSKKLKNVEDDINASKTEKEQEDSVSRVPIDPIDRVVNADSYFVDYSSLASEYFGDESDGTEGEGTDTKKEETKSSKEKQSDKDSTKNKKTRHRVPVESISDEEYMEYSNDDTYSIRQYYKDGDVWTRLNSDNYKDDIPVDDFAIPLSDFRWIKGVAYFVNHADKQLYKFYNDNSYS